MPGIIGNAGWGRERAWTCDFSSTQITTADSGGYRDSPTMSYTLSTNNGSVDNLKPSVRCGLSSNARQIRPTVDAETPALDAIFWRDQWVAFAGEIGRAS